MIYELPTAMFAAVAPLFAGRWFDEAFIDSVFEGTQHGRIFVDHPTQPSAALLCRSYEYYVAGDHTNGALRQFMADAPAEADVFAELYGYCALSPAWNDGLLADHAGQLHTIGRRSFKWDAARSTPLDWQRALPDGFQMRAVEPVLAPRINEVLAPIPGVGFFMGGPDAFWQRGFGACVMHGEQVASVALTGSVSAHFADIDITTAESFRGQGLGTLAAAACVAECLARGLIPTWHTDSANAASAATALKVGYAEGAPFAQLSPQHDTPLRLSTGVWSAEHDSSLPGVTRWQRTGAMGDS